MKNIFRGIVYLEIDVLLLIIVAYRYFINATIML